MAAQAIRGHAVLAEIKLLAGGGVGAPDRVQEHHEAGATLTTSRGKTLRRISRRMREDVAAKPISAPQPLAARRGKTNAPPPSSFKPTFPSPGSSSRSISRPPSLSSLISRLSRTHSDVETSTPRRTILHRMSRSISSNLSKVFKAHGNLLSPEGTQTTPATPEPRIMFPPKLKLKRSSSKVLTMRTRTDSASSRDSMVSVMEYLAKRRLKEEKEVDSSTPVTLEEYDKNCYLYDCELLHITNPNRHDSHSPPVIHCGCDPERPSRRHVHLNNPPEVRQAILAMKKERDGDKTHHKEQSSPRPPEKLPTSTLVTSKALPPPPHSPRKRTVHVSRRREDIPAALVAALNDTRT